MALKTLSALPVFADSLFADRFNRIDRLFSQLTGDTPVGTLPAYDLQKVDDSNFLLSVSVPGWKDNELEIETVGGSLHITGKRAQSENHSGNSQGWIYKGIRRADFQLSFSLPEHAQINQAQLDSGILKIAIHQEIPESEKPRKIAIENQGRVIEHKV
ncbi:TPA: Hsp20 family protein [Klebsiella quasipneumoniae]|nr:Hsp20 family protein [Klebsiella quasipneumoniae]HDK6718866.1 Hsp20 family protein [Klebsiella quasipneumoniae]